MINGIECLFQIKEKANVDIFRSTLLYHECVTFNNGVGLDTGQMVGTVFIDLKKAFDTVDHDLLCKKLGQRSAKGIVLVSVLSR